MLPILWLGRNTDVVVVYWEAGYSLSEIWQAVAARYGEVPIPVDTGPSDSFQEDHGALPDWATRVSQVVLRQGSAKDVLSLLGSLAADLLVVPKPHRLTLTQLLTEPEWNPKHRLDEVIRNAPGPVLVMPDG
jgi:hypothetical protein